MDFFSAFVADSIKILALMTPPAVLSAYLSGTRTYSMKRKRRTAVRTGMAVCVAGLVLYFFGEHLFSIFGFTLDAFRVGAGSLLFLTAVGLMSEKPTPPPTGQGQQSQLNQQNVQSQAMHTPEPDEDISVVPLAIPLCMGPASIGTVMVMGASASGFEQRLVGAASLVAAAVCITLMLFMANKLERVLRRTGIAVLSKLTGLLLAAIAAQVVFTGLKSFLNL